MNKVDSYNTAELATVKDGAALAGVCYLTALKKVKASGIEPVALHQVPKTRGRPSPLYNRAEVEEALGLTDAGKAADDALAAAAALFAEVDAEEQTQEVTQPAE